jgi:hypothetical protein
VGVSARKAAPLEVRPRFAARSGAATSSRLTETIGRAAAWRMLRCAMLWALPWRSAILCAIVCCCVLPCAFAVCVCAVVLLKKMIEECIITAKVDMVMERARSGFVLSARRGAPRHTSR